MHTFAIVEAGGERTATPYYHKLSIKVGSASMSKE